MLTPPSASSSASASLSFWEELKRDPLYAGIDIDRELEQAKRWCKEKNRRLTERFFKNWLSKADRVIQVPKPAPAKQPDFVPDLTPEQIEKNRQFAADMVKKVKDGLRKTSSGT